MKVSLSLEETCTNDVSIVVDALRASTTITIALDKFKEIIPCFTPEEAKELAKKYECILAGERKGSKLEGFDIGNSPTAIKSYESKKDTLILTTSNGTRIMESMTSTILIGSFINSQSVAKAAIELANNHIDVVMAGVNSEFAIEDYLAAGEILYWIEEELNKKHDKNKEENSIKEINYWNHKEGLTEYAKSAILASQDINLCKKAIKESRSGKRLKYLGYEEDVNYCMKRNISKNVAIYKDKILTKY